MTVPLLAVSIPLLDVSLTILRRFLRNQPIFSRTAGISTTVCWIAAWLRRGRCWYFIWFARRRRPSHCS